MCGCIRRDKWRDVPITEVFCSFSYHPLRSKPLPADEVAESKQMIIDAYKACPNVVATKNWAFVLQRMFGVDTLQIRFPEVQNLPKDMWELQESPREGATGGSKYTLVVPLGLELSAKSASAGFLAAGGGDSSPTSPKGKGGG